MIRYKLKCKDCSIVFNSWFASSDEYEKLRKKQLLTCYNCSSLKVDKTLMAPQYIKSEKKSKDNLNFAKHEKIKKTIKNYQKFIKNNFTYVGENFAYEARSIHYDEKKKKKNIYGITSSKDLKDLKDEGIDAKIIPWIDDVDN